VPLGTGNLLRSTTSDGNRLAVASELAAGAIKIDGSFSRDLLTTRPVIHGGRNRQAREHPGNGNGGRARGDDAIRTRCTIGRTWLGFFIGKPLALDDAIHDLPLYSCFATSTGLFDSSLGKATALGG
jgi:hypothetical protein